MRATFTDDAGNDETLTSTATAAITADRSTTPPTVSSIAITSETQDPYYYAYDSYGIGRDIKIKVTFSEDVIITGSPELELDIGGAARSAGYENSNGNSVVFSYTVVEGDSDDDGISIGANKLSLNGGSIKDAADYHAVLSHSALSSQADHSVDGIRPTISDVKFGLSSGGSGGVYSTGHFLVVSLEFSEDVITTGGKPQLKLDFEGTEKLAYGGIWLQNSPYISFSYKVQKDDLDLDGPAVGANTLSINGASIWDHAGNTAVLTHDAVAENPRLIVDAVPPTVSSIAVTSDPGDDDTYGTGDKVEVTVTFSENVRVRKVHSPELELDIGGESRTAKHQSTQGAGVVFAYTVEAGDTDENGIAIGADKLDLNGGAIRDAVGSSIFGVNDADLSHDAVADDPGHKVAGSSSPLPLSGPTTFVLEENGNFIAIYSVSGSDAAITWSLSGDDSDDFSFSSPGGAGGGLGFNSPPNYEDPTDADADNIYEVTIQATDGTNTSTRQVTVFVTNEWLDSDEVPVIQGTAHVGETLTADTSRIQSVPRKSFYYRWVRSDGTTDTDIEGAQGTGLSSYTLVPADEGHTIKVGASFWSREYTTLTSEPTAVVISAVGQQTNTPATRVPTISGTAQVGETLTADTSGIADADGLTNVSYSYQWISNDGTSDTDITGGTDSTYTLVAADEGKTIKVKVSFTDDAGHEEALTSTATVAVAAQSSPNTGAPTIRGTAQVGETLTVDTTGMAQGLVRATFSYQWVANDGTSDMEITGATDSTYTLVAANEGKTIKVSVSFTDDAGYEETLTSAPTATVAAVPNSPATGAPTITGTAQVGETLTADTSGIADTDGLNVSYSFQWVANDGISDTDITGATDSTYTLVAANEGKTIKVSVSFTDDAGYEETLTSAPTATVAAAQEQTSASYITVTVAEDTSDPNNVVTNFSITWSDADGCSTNYNAYLNIKPVTLPGRETPGSQLHLGSAAFDGAEIAKGLAGVEGSFVGFNVELYCGTEGSDRLFSRVDIPRGSSPGPNPGTYSSEPPPRGCLKR